MRPADAFSGHADEEHAIFAAPAPAQLALVRNARQHNASVRINRLPKDTHTEIWKLLPFNDLLTVSHVCKDWRAVALACATLWSDIDTSLSWHRATDDVCLACVRKNAHALEPLMSRSKAAQLRLHLKLNWTETAPACIAALTSSLRSEMHRIHTLDIEAISSYTGMELLKSLSSCPSLRVLTSQCVILNEYDAPPLSSFIRPDQRFPELGFLKVPCFMDTPLPHLVNLCRLSCRIQSASDFSNILLSCPNIEEATFDFILSEDHEQHEQPVQQQQRFRHLQTLFVSNMRHGTSINDTLFQYISSAELRSIQVQTSMSSRLGPALEIFEDIQRPLTLVYRATSKRFVTFRIEDDRLFTRQLSVPAAAANRDPGSALANIRTEYLHTLAIDPSRWNDPVLQSLFHDRYRRVITVRTLIVLVGDRDAMERDFASLPADVLPELERVTVCYESKRRPFPASVVRIAAFLNALSRRVPLLTLRGLTFSEGDLATLEAKVGNPLQVREELDC